MNEIIPLIPEVSSLILSIIALFFTWRIYHRENTINNENFLYQKRFETHLLVFNQAVELVNSSLNISAWLERCKKHKTENNEQELEKEIGRFDEIEEKLEVELLKNSLIIPEQVLEEYFSMLYDSEEWKDPGSIEKWNKVTTIYTEKIDKIHGLVAHDLHLEELDIKLSTRIGKKRRVVDGVVSRNSS